MLKSEEFNKFFISVGKEVKKGLNSPPAQNRVKLANHIQVPFHLFFFTSNKTEMFKLVREFKTKHSTDFDDVPLHVVKHWCNEIVDPLVDIIDSIFSHSLKVNFRIH